MSESNGFLEFLGIVAIAIIALFFIFSTLAFWVNEEGYKGELLNLQNQLIEKGYGEFKTDTNKVTIFELK